jgi:DNA polymerase III subunit gamma/tau
MVLYRKYRPTSLLEVRGQEHITRILAAAVEQKKLAHAYLFTGPRGVGKTSIARILAHAINELPYEIDTKTHLDIIEIDAASNRRIDEIRELRDKVHTAPVAGKYKVYIIDEVHMLTKEAFNALLKTLEEPPKHVIFILATTESHKVPETITSRTQRFRFMPIEKSTIVKQLADIAKKENIVIHGDVLELLAEHAEGSFRDSISLLDQVSGLAELSRENAEVLLGIPPRDSIARLIPAIASGNLSSFFELIDTLKDRGTEPAIVAKELLAHLRKSLQVGEQPLDSAQLHQLQDKLIYVSAAPLPQAALEVACIEAMPSVARSLPTETLQPKKLEQKTPLHVATAEVVMPAKDTEINEEKQQEPDYSKAESPSPPIELDREDAWKAILELVRSTHHTLYTVLRMANLSTTDDSYILSCSFSFHQKQLSLPKNKKVIGDAIEAVLSKQLPLTIELDTTNASSNDKPSTKKVVATKNTDLDQAKNIFGAVEQLS